jgi:hypothetical protein
MTLENATRRILAPMENFSIDQQMNIEGAMVKEAIAVLRESRPVYRQPLALKEFLTSLALALWAQEDGYTEQTLQATDDPARFELVRKSASLMVVRQSVERMRDNIQA